MYKHISPKTRTKKFPLMRMIDWLKPSPPAGYIATGFGSTGACGLLTLMGTFAGKPYYRAAGGWYYCWNPDGGMWICRDAAPGTGDLSNNRYADLQYAEDITDVQWTGGFNPGDMPCGTVTTTS